MISDEIKYSDYLEIISFGIPFIMIFGSYCYIGLYYIKTTNFLKRSNLRSDLEFRTTWTIFLVVLIYAFVFLAVIIIDFVHVDEVKSSDTYLDIYGILLYIYVMPYSTNCYIYILSTQYRNVFIHLFGEWKEFLCNFNHQKDDRSHTFAFDLPID